MKKNPGWQRILMLLSDYKPHSNFEIVEKCYYQYGPSIANVKGRIWDLKQKGCQIESFQDTNDNRKHWYQLKSMPVYLQTSQYKQEQNGQFTFL